MTEDVMTAEGLTKIFNKSLVAVDHINFNVKEGEIFGFPGPNGRLEILEQIKGGWYV